jgi:hypothetical protein
MRRSSSGLGCLGLVSGFSLLGLLSCGSGALTLVTPNLSYPGRTVDVQIAGFGTEFGATDTVELDDPAISAGNIVVGSDGNLRATLTIGAGARLGDHDVIVNSSGKLTLSKGFKVAPSFKADNPQGSTVQQGGIVAYAFLNVDYVQNPLDAFTRLTSGLHSVPGTNTVTAARMNGFALADALVPEGPVAVVGTGVSPTLQVVSYVSDPMDPLAQGVTSRPATPMTPGMALSNQSFPAPRSSNLYKFSNPANDQILFAQFTALGPAFVGTGSTSLQAAVAGADGKWSGGQFADTSSDGQVTPTRTMLAFLPMAGDGFLSVFPTSFGGSANHTYTMNTSLLPGSRLSVAEPAVRDTGAMPLATLTSLSAAMPQFATDGQIEDGADSDYIRYTVASGVTRIYVQVLAPGSTAAVSEYGSMDCSGTAFANSSQSNVTTLELVAQAGTRCLRIRPGQASKYPYPYRLLIVAR